jgi:hypothetical protein
MLRSLIAGMRARLYAAERNTQIEDKGSNPANCAVAFFQEGWLSRPGN